MQSRYRFLTFVPLAMAAFAQDSVTTSLSGGVFSGFAHFGAVRAEHVMTVTGAPYSAEETFTLVQTLVDGTQITRASTTEKVFRDSAGRLRIERTAVPGRLARKQGVEVPVIVELTDPVEHVRYTLDTVNKVAHKQPLTVPARGQAARPPAPAVTKAEQAETARERPAVTHEDFGKQTVEGLVLEGKRITMVFPAGSQDNDRPITVVTETWMSPELKVPGLVTNNDPRSGESTTKLINVNRSEPDPSLFQPPPDYTIIEETGDFTMKWGREKQ
jgi:hypothetical protein